MTSFLFKMQLCSSFGCECVEIEAVSSDISIISFQAKKTQLLLSQAVKGLALNRTREEKFKLRRKEVLRGTFAMWKESGDFLRYGSIIS